jgi:hypothetical protein
MTKKSIRQKDPGSINWQALYKSFSAQVCSVNCGALCAPFNRGIPYCCKHRYQEPILFTGELAWLKTQTALWKHKPLNTRAHRRSAAAIEDYIKYAHCKGIEQCERKYRSLACRFFPFEPYFESGKKFAGLVFMYRAAKRCPLIDHPTIRINQRYINQAIQVWKKIFAAYPREMELYIHNSRGLRLSMKLKNKRIRVFTEKSGVK